MMIACFSLSREIRCHGDGTRMLRIEAGHFAHRALDGDTT